MKGEKELQEEMIKLWKLLNGDDPAEVGVKWNSPGRSMLTTH